MVAVVVVVVGPSLAECCLGAPANMMCGMWICGYNIVNIIPSHTEFNCRVIREDAG